MSKFKKGSLAEEIWNKKYRYNNESWDEFVERIYNQFKINYVDGLKYPIEEIKILVNKKSLKDSSWLLQSKKVIRI